MSFPHKCMCNYFVFLLNIKHSSLQSLHCITPCQLFISRVPLVPTSQPPTKRVLVLWTPDLPPCHPRAVSCRVPAQLCLPSCSLPPKLIFHPWHSWQRGEELWMQKNTKEETNNWGKSWTEFSLDMLSPSTTSSPPFLQGTFCETHKYRA